MYVFMAASARDEMQIIEHSRMCYGKRAAYRLWRHTDTKTTITTAQTHAPRFIPTVCVLWGKWSVCASLISSSIDSSTLDLIRCSHQIILSICFNRCSVVFCCNIWVHIFHRIRCISMELFVINFPNER